MNSGGSGMRALAGCGAAIMRPVTIPMLLPPTVVTVGAVVLEALVAPVALDFRLAILALGFFLGSALAFFAGVGRTSVISWPVATMLMNIPTSIRTLSATHLHGLAFFPKSSHLSSAKLTASAQLKPGTKRRTQRCMSLSAASGETAEDEGEREGGYQR